MSQAHLKSQVKMLNINLMMIKKKKKMTSHVKKK